MPLLNESVDRARKLLSQPRVLLLFFAALALVSFSGHLKAQSQKSTGSNQSRAEQQEVVDPLDRVTPRRTVIGFLQHAERRDFVTAGRYLQPTPGQDVDLVPVSYTHLRAHET